MATTKQKKLAKVIVANAIVDKPLNSSQMLAKVGYAETVAKHKQKDILESDGVKEELRILGFDEATAKEVVSSILKNEAEESKDRLKAAEMVFKVHGSFKESEKPQEKSTITYNFIQNTAIQADIKLLEDAIKTKLLNAHETPTENN